MSGGYGRTARIAEAVRSFFDVDDPWQRPAPSPGSLRTDGWIAGGFFALAALNLELTRSMGLIGSVDTSVWWQYGALILGTVPLIWRRRFPITVMVLLQIHLWCTGIWVLSVAAQLAMQLLYFFSLASGVAWARDRQQLMYVMTAVVIFMSGWFVWGFLGSDRFDWNWSSAQEAGLFTPDVATVTFLALCNLIFFGGALYAGQSSRRKVRRLALLQSQSDTIERQAAHLRDRAVVDERLRIARELHDVVAHHVSVMGVQAAAARHVLTRNPVAAEQALSSVEESSRSAVREMRGLLGTLRDSGEELTDGHERAPEPGLAEIADLVEAVRRPGLQPTYELVEDVPGAAAQVPTPLAVSSYRIVQEALSNIRKHSTATHVSVVIRVETQRMRYVEAEVVDDGRALASTSGTGLGLLGMRERIASHGGQLDIGPRLLGGFRVRVRFPLERGGPTPPLGGGRTG